MSLILYRAMCLEEAINSLLHQEPKFIRRFKWFSPNIDFINNRVRDGKFNNSKFKPERYYEILQFSFTEDSKNYFTITEREYKLDRRAIQMIKCISITRRP